MFPVEIKVTATGLVARAPVEPLTKLQKEIEINTSPTDTAVTVSTASRTEVYFHWNFLSGCSR
jgi:hypothetical protein